MVEPSVLAELDRELLAAPYGTRGKIWERYALLCGGDVRTLQRQLAEYRAARPGEGRKERTDRGASYLDEAIVGRIWALKVKIRRIDPDGQTISTARAIKMALAEGIIDHEIPATTLNRRARDLGLDDPDPVQRFESERANEAHQIDCSGSRVFAYHSPGRVIIRNPRERAYKNKPVAERGRVWLFHLKDDHSRVRFFRYFLSPGESVAAMLPLLIEAWENPEGYDWLFRGLPDLVYGDNGVFAKSAMVKRFLDEMHVKLQTHRPYHSRAKGKVERDFRTWMADFEGPFLLHIGEVLELEDLNQRLAAWNKERNLAMHPRQKRQACIEVWQASALQQTLRLLPPDAARFAFTSGDRKVSLDRMLHLDGEELLMPSELVGHKVDVFRDLHGTVRVIDQRSGKEYGPEQGGDPLAFNEFKAFARTAERQALDEAVAVAVAALPPRLDGEEPSNLVRLQPRGAEVEAVLPYGGPSFHADEEEAFTHISEVLGFPVLELGEQLVGTIRQYLTTNPTRQDVEDFALALRGQVAGRKVVQ